MVRVLNRMLLDLRQFLVPTTGQPDPALILISVNDVPVGLGNFLGEQPRGALGKVEMKGGRLDCVVRFMLWGANPTAVTDGMLTLQADLLSATQRLFSRGFLRFNALISSNPVFDSTLNAWGRTADYSLLYEYHYQATDAADSLIARIPVHTDQEMLDSPDRETTIVSDELARWDEISAPVLAARGPVTLGKIVALVFAPTMPTGQVTLTRTFDGATGPMGEPSSLADFLTALADTGAPQRHAKFSFGSFTEFLSELSGAGDPLQMGDWNLDDTTDEYQGFELMLDPPVHLAQVFDRLELTYGNGDEPLDQVAVIYLRFQ
jgi:hypothetical protein